MAQTTKTAFVFAGGSSLGSIQVGMLKALLARAVPVDFVVGSSAGAINAAYFSAAASVCFPDYRATVSAHGPDGLIQAEFL